MVNAVQMVGNETAHQLASMIDRLASSNRISGTDLAARKAVNCCGIVAAVIDVMMRQLAVIMKNFLWIGKSDARTSPHSWNSEAFDTLL